MTRILPYLLAVVIGGSVLPVSQDDGEAHLALRIRAVNASGTTEFLPGQPIEIPVAIVSITARREQAAQARAMREERLRAARALEQPQYADLVVPQAGVVRMPAGEASWTDYLDLELVRTETIQGEVEVVEVIELDAPSFRDIIRSSALRRSPSLEVATDPSEFVVIVPPELSSSLPFGQYFLRATLDTRGTNTVGWRGKLETASGGFSLRAPQGNSELAAIHYATANYYYQVSEFQAALEAASRSVELDPAVNDYRAYIMIGQIQEQMRNVQAAITAYRLYLDTVPQPHPDRVFGLQRQIRFLETQLPVSNEGDDQ